MTHRPGPPATAVVAASALAAGGMLAHDVIEFGPGFLLDPQTLVPLGIYAVLAALAARWASGSAAWAALLAWGGLNLVGGGILSVLPLGLLPFRPEQSLEHYGVHIVYALAEVPLVVVAWSGFRASRTSRSGADASQPADAR